MSEPTVQAQVDAAKAYETLFVPALFGQWAPKVVLGARQNLATLFKDAGAVSVEITTHQGTARFFSIRVMVEADLRGWLPVMGVILTEEQIGRKGSLLRDQDQHGRKGKSAPICGRNLHEAPHSSA